MRYIKWCKNGDGQVYAREMCRACYQKWWAVNAEAPIRHGVRSTYTNRACRCARCAAAERAYKRSRSSHD